MVLRSVRGRSLFLRFFAESVLGREKKIKKIGGKFIRWTPYRQRHQWDEITGQGNPTNSGGHS